MKQRVKKILSLFLVFAITFPIVSTVLSNFTFAAVIKDVYTVVYPRWNDSNQNGWGHSELTLLNGWGIPASSSMLLRAMGSYYDNICYCIEPGVPEHSGNTLEQKGEDFWKYYPPDYNDTIMPIDIQAYIGRIIQYGYLGKVGLDWVSTDSADMDNLGNAIATQIIIWETVVGERDEDFNKVDAKSRGRNNVLEYVATNNPAYSSVMKHYNRIVTEVQNHKKIPSFCGKKESAAKEYELTYDGTQYSLTLTDTNNVLNNFDFTSSTPGIMFTKNGNQLIISAKTPPAGKIDIQADKIHSKKRALITWSDGKFNPSMNQMQDVVTYGEEIYDPVPAYLNVKVSTGNLKLIKTSEDGLVANLKFQVKGKNVDGIYSTGNDGSFQINNLEDGESYTFTEVETPNQYLQPASQTVKVQAGKTTEIRFENKQKRGSAMFQKTDLDTGKEIESKDGVFAIYEWNKNSKTYSKHSTMKYDTAKKGYVTTKDLIITAQNEGKFRCVEEKAPTGYVKPTNLNYDFTITQNGQIFHINNGKITNEIQKGKAAITKTDVETGKGVPNAVYGLYARENIVVNGVTTVSKGTKVQQVTTNEDGYAISKELDAGKYFWKEISSPPGYVLDKNEYDVVISYQGQDVPVYTVQTKVTDTPQKGRLQISKTDAETGKAVVGAVYGIYARDNVSLNGEIKYKKDVLVDTVTTGSNGIAYSKYLYLGNYYVKEKSVPTGYVLDKTEHDVSLTNPGQTVSVFTKELDVTNTPQKGRLQISKTDAETGKPVAGAVYEIFARNNITFNGEIKYKQGVLVDTVTTGSNGIAYSKYLYLGNYYVKEKTVPHGYVIDKTEHDVSLTYQGQSVSIFTKDLDVTDTPQKGRLHLTKDDPETGKGVPGAVYELFARDNIIVNGETKVKKGALVQTLTTNQNGEAYSKYLYLGKYYVKEKKAPDGYVIDPKEYDAELTYQGQDISIFTENLNVTDAPQKGKLHLKKVDSETKKGVPNAIYQIFARDNIVVNGDVKLKAGTVADTLTTNKNGEADSKYLYLGNYYVKEKTAPDGYVIDKKEYNVSLTYQGQDVEIFTEALNVEDSPQKGKIHLQKTDSETKKGVPNAVYEIRARNDVVVNGDIKLKTGALATTLTTDKNGEATSPLLYLGNYYVKEKTAPDGYVIDKKEYDVQLTYQGQEVAVFTESLNVSDNPQKGRLKLVKTDSETGKGVPNAIYEIRARNDVVVNGDVKLKEGALAATLTTNQNGEAYSKYLYLGNYFVKEIKAPDGYVIDKNEYDVSLTYQGQEVTVFTKPLDVEDTPQKGRLEISKTDPETGKGVPGAVYEIFARDNIVVNGDVKHHQGALIDTVTTGKNGIAYSQYLYLGNYYVKEKTAPDGYVLDKAEHDVSLTYRGQEVVIFTQTVSVTDAAQKARIHLKKTDSETGKGVPKAVYEVLARKDIIVNEDIKNKAGSVVDTLTTDQNGEAYSKYLYLGDYYVREKTAPDGYVIDPREYDISLTYKGQEVDVFTEGLDVEDTPQKAKIHLLKTDSETKKGVPNAVYEIRARNDVIVNGDVKLKAEALAATLTTDKNGEAISPLLYLGNYYVKEKTAPDGYVIDKKEYDVQLTYQGQEVTVFTESLNVLDNPQKGRLKLVKTDSETGKGVPDAVYEVLARKDVVLNGDIKLKAGEVADVLTTDQNGEAYSKYLYLGDYYVREKTAPDGYVIDKNEYDVSLTYQGQEITVFTKPLDVEDAPQKGRLEISKTDPETGKGVPGAVYEIFARDNIVVNGDVKHHQGALIDTVTTGKNGIAYSQYLYLGNYYVKEKTAPDGYVLDTKEHDVSLIYQGQEIVVFTQTVPVTDAAQKARIHLKKTDSETGKGVPDAVYEIFARKDIVVNGDVKNTAGSVVDTLTTDQNGEAYSKYLYLGDYYVKEKTAPNGYVLDREEHDVSLTYKGQEIDVFTEGLDVEDTPQKARIHLQKTDSETKKGVPNAVYEIRARNDVIVNGDIKLKAEDLATTLTTDKNGEAYSKYLYLGDYYVKEKTAPDGYVIDREEHDISLTYKGQEVDVFTEGLKAQDTPQKARLHLLKTDSETGKGIPGAIYEIFVRSDVIVNGDIKYPAGTVVDVLTTDQNGEAYSDYLYLGNYYAKEKTAPHGYVIDETEHDFALEYAGQEISVYTHSLEATDSPQKGKAELIKTDSETGKGVPGAVYDLFVRKDIILNGDVKFKAGTLIDTQTTDQNGHIISGVDLYLGDYYWKERTAPYGYVLDTTEYDFSLEYAGQDVVTVTKTVEVTDIAQKAKIIINKKGEMLSHFNRQETEFGDKYTPVYQVQNLPNAEFEIYAYGDIVVNGDVKHKDGELLDRIVTAEDGKAASIPLEVNNKYLVKEISAPGSFLLDKNEYIVELKYAGQDVAIYDEPLTIFDERQKAQVQLTKLIEENTYYPDPEAYQSIIFGIFANETIFDADGKMILQKGDMVDYFGIDKSLKGVSQVDLPPNTSWYVQELQTADGLVLNQEKFYFQFDANNPETPLLKIDLNADGTVIQNETVKGFIEYKKKSSFDGRPLEAVYGIYRASDDMLIQELKSDLNNWVRSQALPKGLYYLAEIEAPDRYHHDTNKYYFFIGSNDVSGITLQLTVEDQPVIGSISAVYDEGTIKEGLDGIHSPQISGERLPGTAMQIRPIIESELTTEIIPPNVDMTIRPTPIFVKPPQTGDQSPYKTTVCIAITSLVTLIVAIFLKRKDEKAQRKIPKI